MGTSDWNPHLYLKFDRERTQPAIDLIARIRLSNPHRILDVGCGPGNSTLALARRWPESELIGIDNSPAMIAKAKNDYPFIDWRLCDASTGALPGNLDLLFSNATIQWIPGHAALLRRFAGQLVPGGVIAVQLPQFFEMPIGRAIEKTASLPRWSASMAAVCSLYTMHTAPEYYEMLASFAASVELWVTDYVHVMASHDAIIEMVRGAGLKPYLDCCADENDREQFVQVIADEVRSLYPAMSNNNVLFPFRRLFFIATV